MQTEGEPENRLYGVVKKQDGAQCPIWPAALLSLAMVSL